MTTHFPRYFKFILIIAAWQTYRVVGAVGWGDLHLSGGDVFPNAWVIPLWQDTATGLLAPLIVFMMASQVEASPQGGAFSFNGAGAVLVRLRNQWVAVRFSAQVLLQENHHLTLPEPESGAHSALTTARWGETLGRS